MRVRTGRTIGLACLALLTSVSIAQAKYSARGTYVDSQGQRHEWSISNAHSLLWDGRPYLPIGGEFCPRYLAEQPSEENWKRDTDALASLKSHGLTDLLIDPVVSAPDVPAAAWQRLVDYLEANGFHYGIAFGKGVGTPLTGIHVKPAAFRREGLRDGADVTWELPDASRAFYVVVDPNEGSQVLASGAVPARSGRISFTVNAHTTANLLGLIYPRRSLAPTEGPSLPDLWQGFDAYRDNLLKTLGGVKFGPGLRFFANPLVEQIGISPDAESLIPDSLAFRTEWEDYLKRHYSSVDALVNAWACQGYDLTDYRQAARLVPLWLNSRGCPMLLDPQDNKRTNVIMRNSRFWADFQQFRREAIGYYMSTMADLLKREIANVPVVYTRSQTQSFFVNKDERAGFDGLGIAAYGRGSSLVTGGADETYADCEQSPRTMWCLVTETMAAAPSPTARPGYDTKPLMHASLDMLRMIGAKGFFVKGYQVLPETDHPNMQLAAQPEQLDWLKEYGARFVTDTAASAQQPRVLYYPLSAAGIVRPGALASGTWWVPSMQDGAAVLFGTSYAGYTIKDAEGDATVMWSLRGPRETRFMIENVKGVQVETPEGVPVKTKVDAKHRLLTLEMPDTPIVIRNAGGSLFPVEAAADTAQQLRALVADAILAKLSVDTYRYMPERIDTLLKDDKPQVAYYQAQQALYGLIAATHIYEWIEGESATSHTFSEITREPAASGAAYLSLSTDGPAPNEGYVAQYAFTAAADGVYNIWVAATPAGPDTSAFEWAVDNSEAHVSTNAQTVGSTYLGNQFAWYSLGKAELTAGKHQLTLRVPGKAPQSGKYRLSVDCLLVTRGEFQPNGVIPPRLSENAKPLPDPYYGLGKKK